MSTLDEISQKRLERQQVNKQEQHRQENIGAVLGSGREVVGATDKLAKTTDIDSLLRQMKEMTLAQFMAAQNQPKASDQKPTVILTDQTDLGVRFKELGEKLIQTVSTLNSSDIDNKNAQSLKDLLAAIKKLNDSVESDGKATVKAQKELLQAITGIDFTPTIKVPEIKLPKFDLSPIENVLREYIPKTQPDTEEASEKIDMECYKAQDINNSVEGYQYIGFVNPDGGWYIIENDINGNKLRYVFGASDYAEAFSKASSYEYRLLNEAVDAL